MAKDKPTAEEQLLNLIEEGEGPKTLRLKRKKNSWLGFFSFSGVVSFLPSLVRTLQDQLARLKSAIREPNLKVWNKVLAVLAILAFIYLTADFIFRRLDISQISKKISKAGARNFKEVPLPEARPFLYYLEMVQRRDIFSPVVLKSNVENADSETKKALAALILDLKLVGISWGKDPEAMIEDKKTSKTYFLKTGDTINTLKVDTILKDKVIFNSGGEKMELM